MESLAIVGISFKLPHGAVDEQSLWRILEERMNVSTAWPSERVNLQPFFDRNQYAHGAHFLAEDPALFDAPFFSITAQEAAAMDPQQRLALEAAYHAFENGKIRFPSSPGMAVESLRGSQTAVFGATMSDDYCRMSSKDADAQPLQAITGMQPAILPNRISWYFDLRGPSVHLDTACSGSMIALDMACQALRNGSASTALVVGSNLLLSPEPTVLLSRGNFLSPDSKCFSFDSRANGYARGEGIVAIVVKPINDALRDGDVIRAVIRATGSNQDGRTPTLTQPSPESQEALIRHVYTQGGLDYNTTRYYEAHGTGTKVGDPIEMAAIGNVFKDYRSTSEPLFVGSLKSNIGHLEGASGGAGIMKAILTIEKGVISPNALFEKMNPAIDADLYKVQVPTQNIPWPAPGLRRVSVNSFGYGGTNAHVVLDDAFHYLQARKLTGFHNCTVLTTSDDTAGAYQTSQLTHPDDQGKVDTSRPVHMHDQIAPRLLVWSAADAGALHRMTNAYQDFFQANIAGNRTRLDQLAYTLAARRSAMLWRTFALALEGNSTVDDQPEQRSLGHLSFSPQVRVPIEDTHIAFVFTGQGAQYVEMGLELLKYPIFRKSMEKSDEILADLGCSWSIFSALRDASRINHPECSQPLCTALQVALVELLRTFNISPVAVVGHSSGEIAAAYAAGALSHESACKVAYFRGRWCGRLHDTVKTPGAMLAVNLSKKDMQMHLEALNLLSEPDTICIACLNSVNNVTLSGYADAVEIVKAYLDQLGIFTQKLNTGVAYHSSAMRAIAAEYHASIGSLKADHGQYCDLTAPMVSSVTGLPVSSDALRDPQYWVDNLVSPVRFADALENMGELMPLMPRSLKSRRTIDVIEIGPHPALRRLVSDSALSPLRHHSTLRRNSSAIHSILDMLGTLFCYGHPVSVLAGNLQERNTIPYLVDCPSYPFDHSRRYWTEPRLSKDLRLRPSSSGYFLGRRANDYIALRPRWRYWLSTDTIPWLQDHVISNTTLCPGTGMLIMSIEAVKQVAASDGRIISGFLLRDVQLLAPISVGTTTQESPEIILELCPVRNTNEKEVTWYDVSIFACRDERWTECFHSSIQVQFAVKATTQVDGGRESKLRDDWFHGHFNQILTSCTKPIDRRAFYDFCAEHGIVYGKSFQLLHNIAWDRNNKAAADIRMTANDAIDAIDSPVHPAILDACIHLSMIQISKGLSNHISTLVPQRISEAWVSARTWKDATATVRLTTALDPTADSTGRSNSVTVSGSALADDGSLLATFENVLLTEVSRYRPHSGTDKVEEVLLYNIAWKPQLSALSPSSLTEFCNDVKRTHDETFESKWSSKAELAMRVAARRALRLVTEKELDLAPVYLQRCARALNHLYLAPEYDKAEDMSEPALESLLEECERGNPECRVFFQVARELPSILRGDTDPLELMFTTKSAESLYAYLAGRQMRDGGFEAFLDLISHEKPSLKILEVGAGTGSITCEILAALQRLEQKTGQSRFASYTYTDISPGFFETAKSKLDHHHGRLQFKTLDLERDPNGQSFELGSYDLVVAGFVLHATSDLTVTLGRLRQFLKPGGYIAIQEVINPRSACANVTFGSLEGWWLSTETWREYTPLLNEEGWGDLLLKTGFSGAELILRDSNTSDGFRLSSMIVSKTTLSHHTKPSEDANGLSHPRRISILRDPFFASYRALAGEITRGYSNTQLIELSDITENRWAPLPNEIVVCMLELWVPFFMDLSPQDFHALQNLVHSVRNLLWISHLPTIEDGMINPFSSISTGFLRAVQSEENDKQVVTLMVESDTPTVTADFVSHILDTTFMSGNASTDREFIVRNGKLMVGRLFQELEVDMERQLHVTPRLRSEPWKPGPSLALELGEPGLLNTFRFIEDPVFGSELDSDEIEIEAEAWPLSFHDVFVALGRLSTDRLGVECAGVVTRTGANCVTDLRPGDRAVMVFLGCMRTHPRAKADLVVRVPESLTLHEAVASLNPGVTAYHSLINVARLQRGEKILIHSGAGSTGQMAIELAKELGAEIFTTVGYDDKKQLLMDRFGIPEDHIFYSRDTSFAKGIMRVTHGHGVDVILNSLLGEGLRASWACIAPYGRFIEIGKMDISSNSGLPMGRFSKNVMFAAVDMLHISQTNPKLMRQLVIAVLDFIAQRGGGGPRPLHLYPLTEVEKAFRYMQSGTNTGRIILSGHDTDIVPKFMVQSSNWTFETQASYMIAGGFGGIGRAILRWMVKKGARNLIVLSRSGPSSQAAVDTITELTNAGVRIESSPCDITSVSSLSALLHKCSLTFPPIKGCINAAMVLQDAVFANMTHAQWSTALRVKVKGSWNLHSLLPKNMDFFILLSSLGGIYGSSGQSNYAAGCTFQDALARYRTVAGYRSSISIDLGWMRTIGIIAEREEYRRTRQAAGDMSVVEESDFFALLDHYCNPSLPGLKPDQSQILLGVFTQAHSRARGEVPSDLLSRPLFAGFDAPHLHQSETNAAATSVQESPGDLFRRTADVADRSAIFQEALGARLARAIDVDAKNIDPRRTLSDYGTDSLMAVELRNWIRKDFGVSVAIFDIMGGSDIITISKLIAERYEGVKEH